MLPNPSVFVYSRKLLLRKRNRLIDHSYIIEEGGSSMSQLSKIVFLGGDLRQYYMIKQLMEAGFPVAVYGLDRGELGDTIYEATTLKEALSFGNIVICPIPVSKNQVDIFSKLAIPDLTLDNLKENITEGHTLFGGCFHKSMSEFCTKKNIRLYDLMEIESVSIANAIATAEGTLAEAIKRSPINLHKNECLVLGFGRCAKILADKLKGIGAKVSIGARNEEALAYADAYGYENIPLSELSKHLDRFPFIFNTIPTMVLDSALISYVRKDVVIIDISSKPGGVNFDYCDQLGINASLCLGLPGIYAPKTSALILVTALLDCISSGASSKD